ncbi:hypothetical protein C1T21_00700 [Paenibacillus sp. F4]|nr:hypothetical protein C1T21_00700 [Paenibacillus sp. F4]
MQIAEETTIQKQYKAGLNYMQQMGFTDAWPEYERFKAGDQWPKPTAKTKTMPRPVFNIVRYIQNHKVSSVMNENVNMLFSAQENVNGMPENEEADAKQAQEAGDLFTRFSATTWENVKQDELNEEALESGSSLGTSIWHYYWDDNRKGGLTRPYKGDMAGEVLDPINVFFGNPQQRRVQRQPYIIISSREPLDAVRKEAKANKLSDDKLLMINADKETQVEAYDPAKRELDGSEKVTLLTKYWKEGGKVYFTKEASGQPVKPKTDTGFVLYPIVVMQWERRKKAIHGVGDAEGIIPNQKAINFLMAMQLLSVQLTGWPKMVYNPNFIDAKSLNNDPSQAIPDQSPPGQRSIDYLTPGPVSPLANGLVESFMDYTKMLSSAQDASTGDMSSGNLNATAIMLLQKAAGVPIESIKKRFYRAIEDIGRVWEQFWKVRYNTTRRVNLENDDGEEYSQEFKGTDYANIELNLKIDVGPASTYSEELMMSSLDKLFDAQQITLDDYLEFAPKNVIPFKDRLLKRIQERQEQQAAQEAAMQQMQAQQPQEDPAAAQEAQLQQQLALKQQDHANRMELEQVKAQTQLQQAAMRQTATK